MVAVENKVTKRNGDDALDEERSNNNFQHYKERKAINIMMSNNQHLGQDNCFLYPISNHVD